MGSIITKSSIDDVFLNVRRAYRLLFDYQTRLLSLGKYIGNYFSYSYYGGWPLYSAASPKAGEGSLDNLAWDWLNMYAYAFHFGSKEIKGKKVFFEIRIYSDTGFFDSRERNELDTNTFLDVNKSKTKIVLIASSSGWKPNELLEKFNSEKSEYKLNNEENNICAKSYDLLEFYNEEETNRKLDDFSEYCKINAIKINNKA